MNKTTALNIPETLHLELIKSLESSVFNSVDDLASFVLQEHLDKQKENERPSAEEDEQAIKERLRNLGYL